MPTAIETTTAIQDKMFEGIEAGQKAVVDCVRAWAETVETTFSKLPELATAEPVRPSQFLETTLSFSEKVMSSQRDFASRVFEAALPATRVPSATAQAARAQAPKATPPRG